MAIERTLSIIKPDATRRNLTGKVNACLEAAGLRIIAQKRLQMTRAQAALAHQHVAPLLGGQRFRTPVVDDQQLGALQHPASGRGWGCLNP